jgi:hypothetical protein
VKGGLSRRGFNSGLTATALLASLSSGWPVMARSAGAPRIRVIIDNDFAGDPDGLFQLAHHALSPSVEIPLIVASHLHAGESWNGDSDTAASGAREAERLLALLKINKTVLAGSEARIGDRVQAKPSGATQAIINEAMRDDTETPLYYVAGAGLTEIALAWLKEPRIARRMKLIWIGGGEYAGIDHAPPGGKKAEYNLTIDTGAAQLVFNKSDIDIWQVPRSTYRQLLFSGAELDALASSGPLGAYLAERVARVPPLVARLSGGKIFSLGETYVLGDSPLVTLTALQSPFEPDPSSSQYKILPRPRILDDGTPDPNPDGPPIRVYTQIDTRLTFADMLAKFRSVDR